MSFGDIFCHKASKTKASKPRAMLGKLKRHVSLMTTGPMSTKPNKVKQEEIKKGLKFVKDDGE